MCILVVEDEYLIRLIVAEELADAGFEVCEAESGDAAALIIERAEQTFTLLITDIHMPGQLNGVGLGRLMRTRHPSVPIIYTTGRPDALSAVGQLRDKEVFMPKPFAPSNLLAIARRLLDDGRSTAPQA